MNAVTESITPETTEFQRSVLRAMLELAGSNTSNEIAKRAGFKPEPVRVCLARMRDNGLIGTEVNPDKGGPPLWHLRASVDTVRSMVAGPRPATNDSTPGDGEPAPEPDDTQAVDAAEAAPVAGHAASLDDPDNFGDDEMQTAAPDPDGWIPWRGGECPVPEGVACWVRLRGGLADICHTPERLFWGRWIDGDNDDDIVDYRLAKPAHLITPAYAYAVATESAADSAPLTGTDVCSADAVIADWKREHAPAAPAIAPADHFAVWLADTPAGCAGQRAIDAAEKEAARLEAEAAEMAREAAETRQRGLIVAEIIQFADQRNASTSTSEAEFGLAELMAAAYEAVTGKRVA